MSAAPSVILASGSPRRRAILAAAGIEALVMVPEIDDARAPADSRVPAMYTMSLAWFKARQVMADAARALGAGGPRWIVAADTMCVLDGAVVGKPADAADAARMLRSFAGRSHAVVTGVWEVALWMAVGDGRNGARMSAIACCALSAWEWMAV